MFPERAVKIWHFRRLARNSTVNGELRSQGDRLRNQEVPEVILFLHAILPCCRAGIYSTDRRDGYVSPVLSTIGFRVVGCRVFPLAGRMATDSFDKPVLDLQQRANKSRREHQSYADDGESY